MNMEIGSMFSSHVSDRMQQATSASENKINNLQETNLTNATDEELMGVCKQFEAYFLEQAFKGMKKTVLEAEEMSSQTAALRDYFEDGLWEQYATTAVEQENFGLAQMLYEQMKRN